MDRTPSVLFTVAQSLTDDEKKLARENIGATAGVVSFDPNTAGLSDMIVAATAGDTALHGSGSSLVPYSIFVSGAYPELHSFANGAEHSYKWNGTQWVHSTAKFQPSPDTGRLTIPLNGTATIERGDWTFVFSVNSSNAANVNIKNTNATSADIFSESRTYGNTVRLAGEDLSNGKDITYCGNGDFNAIPTRIVMDIRTDSEWLELRMLQFTSGSNLVIDYKVG